MGKDQVVIELENVSKMYKSGVMALDSVDIEIEDGDFLYVIGPSGAGKSTLIKLLYREERATEGKVRVNGTDLMTMKKKDIPWLRRHVGCVFQDFKLLPKKTVFENISFVLDVINTPERQIEDKVHKALEKMDLLDKKDQFPLQLSGGQQQRVAIARAIVNEPRVLIADEPTGNLDPDTGEEIIEELLRINEEEGTTVLITTHNREIVDKYQRRVIKMDNGKVVRDEEEGVYDDRVGSVGEEDA